MTLILGAPERTQDPRCGPETAEQMETIHLLDFLLTEHSTLQCHKTWSLSHPPRQGRAQGAQRGSQSCESGMGWQWVSELETSLEEPARPQRDFSSSSQQEQLQLDPDTMPRHQTVPCDTQISYGDSPLSEP